MVDTDRLFWPRKLVLLERDGGDRQRTDDARPAKALAEVFVQPAEMKRESNILLLEARVLGIHRLPQHQLHLLAREGPKERRFGELLDPYHGLRPAVLRTARDLEVEQLEHAVHLIDLPHLRDRRVDELNPDPAADLGDQPRGFLPPPAQADIANAIVMRRELAVPEPFLCRTEGPVAQTAELHSAPSSPTLLFIAGRAAPACRQAGLPRSRLVKNRKSAPSGSFPFQPPAACLPSGGFGGAMIMPHPSDGVKRNYSR